MYGYITYGTPTHNTAPHTQQYYEDNGEPGPPVHALAQQPPENLLANFGNRPSIGNPNLNVRTYFPVSWLIRVTQNCMFWSLRMRRRDATISSPKGKKTKQGKGKYLSAPQNAVTGASAQRQYAVLFVLVFCFVVLGGSVPEEFSFSYYISTNLKLTYILHLPFYFCIADPP